MNLQQIEQVHFLQPGDYLSGGIELLLPWAALLKSQIKPKKESAVRAHHDTNLVRASHAPATISHDPFSNS